MTRTTPPPSAPPGRSQPPPFPGGPTTDPYARGRLSKSLSTPGERPPGHGRGNRPHRNTVLNRAASIKEDLSTGAAKFFGISPPTRAQTLPFPAATAPLENQTSESLSANSQLSIQSQKWEARRMRHCTRLYGGVKESTGTSISGTVPPTPMTATIDVADFPIPGVDVRDPYHVPGRAFDRATSVESRASTIGGFFNENSSCKYVPLQRRESVAKMAWDGFSTLITKGSLKPKYGSSRRRDRLASRSFSPGTAALEMDSGAEIFSDATGSLPTAVHADSIPMATIMESAEDSASRKASAAVLPLSAVEIEFKEKDDRPPVDLERDDTLPIEQVLAEDEELRRRLEGVDVPDARPRLKHQPTTMDVETPLTDEVFFDMTPSSPRRPHQHHYQPHRHYQHQNQHLIFAGAPHRESHQLPRLHHERAKLPPLMVDARRLDEIPDRPPIITRPQSRRKLREAREQRLHRQDALQVEAPPEEEAVQSLWSRLAAGAFRNSTRKKEGLWMVGSILGRSLKKKSELESHVIQQLDDFDDHRPFFTYWVTTVQILVLIVSLSLYGFGPVGFNLAKRSGSVMHSSVTWNQESIQEPANFWLGPRHAALVHLGAKYSPCMRHDKNIFEQVIDANKAKERETSCCIYNDRAGCYQTSVCASLFAETEKWTVENPGPKGRTSGTVCGQDPRDCLDPRSVDWPDDITKWPICATRGNSTYRHMTCEVSGRPCCFGIQGECRITTREYCNFVDGYFHENATLCSQVSCLGEVCGMIPFFRRDNPDQFYRLFISLFLHAGIIHLVMTVVIQFWMMRDLEKLVGCSRLAIIYLVSGIGGNLASAIFVPYLAEVGPAGSQVGLLAGLFVDLVYHWKMIQRPLRSLAKLSGVLGLLLVLGLLPWVDNWAHLFGFLFGFLLSLALFPYIQFQANDRRTRIVIVVASLLVAVGLMSILVILFYVSPIWDCPACAWFNCIPFTNDICHNKGLQLKPLPI